MKIVKISFSSEKTAGTELAPDRIVEKTKEIFVSEDGVLPVFDAEDADANNLHEKAKEILRNNAKPAFLGGDHSITLPLVKAFKEAYPENPGIIIFDAHPDANNDLMAAGKEDLLCGLINQNIIKKENIVLVGIRNWAAEEIEFIKRHRVIYKILRKVKP